MADARSIACRVLANLIWADEQVAKKHMKLNVAMHVFPDRFYIVWGSVVPWPRETAWRL